MFEEGKNIQTTEAKKQTSSYRSIFKATSLFGGLQVYQIIIQIIRSKFVAVLLGPTGVGIVGLYQSGLTLIQTITGMGLSSSAVRDVSEANGTNDSDRISKTVTVVRKLVRVTGILGMLCVIALSPILSRSSFGKLSYTLPFIFLSTTLLLNQLNAGQRVVLQGMRRLKDLAKCSAIGATIGLFVAVPLYYLWGVDGIVPNLIISSFITLLISTYYSRRVKINSISVSIKETLSEGRRMLVMGISMSLSAVLTSFVAYIIRGFIQQQSGVEMVGLYQAGFAIINTYVGMIFTAISTDYYPRLAAVNKDNYRCREMINQQGEISVLILGPMLSICLIFMPFFLRILYSEKFLGATLFISWASFGMMFRLASWVISFVFVAKAESKLFMINEMSGTVYNLVFSIFGYKFWGLQGLGIAFAATYFVYFLQVFFIAKKKYNFGLDAGYVRCYILQFVLVVLCLLISFMFADNVKYFVGSVMVIISCAFGIIGLDKRMGIIKRLRKR